MLEEGISLSRGLSMRNIYTVAHSRVQVRVRARGFGGPAFEVAAVLATTTRGGTVRQLPNMRVSLCGKRLYPQ